MHAQGTAFLGLTAAAGICVTLAGCASGVSARASAAGTPAATQQAGSQRHGHVTGSSPTSAADTAARNGTRPGQAPQPTAAAAPASHASASGQAASGRTASARLASGLYTDGPDGSPHYVLAFTASAGSPIRGSASFLYQDGRIATVGSYTGTLSGSGKLTLTFGDGKILSGTYAGGRLDLDGCAAALPMASAVGGCTFTYHGHVP